MSAPREGGDGGAEYHGRCERSWGKNLEHHCGEPASHHVIWDIETRNGFCCPEHAAEARRLWDCVMHAVGPNCGMPGSFYNWDRNECEGPDADGSITVPALSESVVIGVRSTSPAYANRQQVKTCALASGQDSG